MITGFEERGLQRELRYYCIMGSQTRPFASQAALTAARRPTPDILVQSGLVDPSGALTPRGQQFMRA